MLLLAHKSNSYSEYLLTLNELLSGGTGARYQSELATSTDEVDIKEPNLSFQASVNCASHLGWNCSIISVQSRIDKSILHCGPEHFRIAQYRQLDRVCEQDKFIYSPDRNQYLEQKYYYWYTAEILKETYAGVSKSLNFGRIAAPPLASPECKQYAQDDALNYDMRSIHCVVQRFAKFG